MIHDVYYAIQHFFGEWHILATLGLAHINGNFGLFGQAPHKLHI